MTSVAPSRRPTTTRPPGPRGRLPHTRHAYLPFGAGPRVCLGTYLGTLQLVPATSRLVHRYRVTVTTPADRPASPQALLVPEGMRVRLVERQPDGSEAPAGRTRTPACP
jgi:cytochrome P450